MPIINGREIVIDKRYTMAVTGHRNIKEVIPEKTLISIFEGAIYDGYDTFLVGMAVGFDTLCFRVLEKLRKNNNIRIIACIPCENQDKKFSFLQKLEYRKMINSADEMIVLSKEYTPSCMLNRNRFMVNNCSYLLAYLREEKGGTNYTVDYAERCGVRVRII
jgi:uncharacterized phage-like protein YoqJ